jgi:hypothetical protein
VYVILDAPKNKKMDSKAEQKAAILKTVELELDAFLEVEGEIKDSVEYEKALWTLGMGFARAVLKRTSAPVSTNRNKKKDSDHLGSDSGGQESHNL